LFEHTDPRQGYHPDWNSYIFNYGRNEVRSFLLSSALFWLNEYHADGCAWMRSRRCCTSTTRGRKGSGFRTSTAAGRTWKRLISCGRSIPEVYRRHGDVQTIAEESTAWPMVSRPLYVGGLGFGMKWDMGWMHDTLQYMSHDPIHRKYHHNQLTFRMIYAFNENFCLPLVARRGGPRQGIVAGKDARR
jgi:1,4-alpha-glucan branching enzyme